MIDTPLAIVLCLFAATGVALLAIVVMSVYQVYRYLQTTLTREEQKSLERAACVLGDHPIEKDKEMAATIRELLERLK